ncbi:dTDP-4-amino-4,6-dideoxyglucose formyltransferase [Marinobacterium sp. MBR-109]|uniref:dTDP-4-amino-4,6-dideoxyglucose formyltransferase n=1 Tax=Marinobacterium sp. MBR-109 TaxID=3156462 RepID=UPI003399ECC8
MNVFFVTDNRKWFSFLDAWRKKRTEKIAIFCSPKGVSLFKDEIDSGLISELDITSSYRSLCEEFDLGVSCHCKQIFPEALVSVIPCFNFHPGLNPHNRGWFPQVFSIINGKPVGATLHRMDKEIDHGPVIDQVEVDVRDWDTSKSVYDRVLSEEFKLFNKWIDRLIRFEYEEKKLDSVGNYNSITDFKKLCEIDLQKKVTFKEAIDYLRAMTFDGYDNAFFEGDDGKNIFVSINIKIK